MSESLTPAPTQPVSVASLPLPTGASTSANQSTGNTSLSSIDTKLTDAATQTTLALIKAKTDNIDVALSTRTKPADAQHVIVDSGVTTGLTDIQLRATPVPVSGTVSANASQTGTWTVQPGNTANTTAWKVDGSAATQPVSGTITANAGTNLNTSALALDATLTGGTQKSKITDGTNETNILKSDGTAAGQNAQLVGGTYLSVAFTTTTAQAVASTDAGNYGWVSVQITGQGGSSTVTFQVSNDNSNWVSAALFLSSNASTSAQSSPTTTGIWHGAIQARYFRLNVTGIVSGTTAGNVTFFSSPKGTHTLGVSAAQNGTWTVGSNSATGSAVPANAFYLGVNNSGNLGGVNSSAGTGDANGGAAMLPTSLNTYAGGGTYDRAKAIVNATNSTGTGILAVGAVAQFDDVSPTAITENQFGNLRMSANRNLYGTIRDAAGNERGVNVNASNQLSVSADAVVPGTGATNLGKAEDAVHASGDTGVAALAVRDDTLNSTSGTEGDYEMLHTTADGALWVTQAPSTSNGWSTFMASSGDGSTALTNTAQAVKASAGTLGGWYIYNPNATAAYVIIYNVASGSVTVGTTNPQMVLAIPATSAANVEFGNGINFTTAIAVAATTTGGGNAAPTTALEANFYYK